MLAPFQIRKFLDLSTGHLPLSDRGHLERYARSGGSFGLTCLSGPHGWFVHVPLDPYSHDWPGSRSLRAVLVLARNHDCDYVLFDADGPVDAALRFFDDDEDE